MADEDTNRLKQRLEATERIGNQLANVAFNLGQGKTLSAREREICATLAKEWDSRPR